MPLFVFPLLGFLVGLIMVSIGGGGGSVYVGILTAFLNVPPAIAVTTSLATGLPTTTVGAISHWRAGNVNKTMAKQMVIWGIGGSVVGSLVSGYLNQQLYTVITALTLLYLSVNNVVVLVKKHRGTFHSVRGTRKGDVESAAYGILAGLMSGIVGLSGGGAITAGLIAMGCSALETIGTSATVLVALAASSFLMHIATGVVDWQMVLLLASGTVVGAWLSPKLLGRFDQRKLDRVFTPLVIAITTTTGTMLLLR